MKQNPTTHLVLNMRISNSMSAIFGDLILLKYGNKLVPGEKNAGYSSSPRATPTGD